MKDVLAQYESDWKQLSPIVFKLTKLADYVDIDEKLVVSPEVVSVISNFDEFKRQSSHTTLVHRNHLGAL